MAMTGANLGIHSEDGGIVTVEPLAAGVEITTGGFAMVYGLHCDRCGGRWTYGTDPIPQTPELLKLLGDLGEPPEVIPND